MAKPMTTDDLIASVQRRAMLPSTQNTFTKADFLAFANDEMDIGILPHVLQYHEDYLMQADYLPVTVGQSYYQIPYRASGNKLRMANYIDPNGNVYEMTRASIEDLPYYQNGSFGISNQGIRAFMVMNDEIVLLPVERHSLVGWLQMTYYLRPSQLVPTDQASVITSFDALTGTVNVDNIPTQLLNPVPMDLVQTKAPNKRMLLDTTPTAIGATSFTFGSGNIYTTAAAAKSTIAPSTFFSLIGNGAVANTFPYDPQADDVITPSTFFYQTTIWYDTTGSDPQPVVPNTVFYVRVNVSAAVTAVDVINATVAAFMATPPMHFTAANVNNTLQINTDLVGIYSNIAPAPSLFQFITTLGTTVLPDELKVGDTVVVADTTIYPNVPVEMHSVLAQRVACRCLEALGDQAGLQAANAKLQEMEYKAGSVLDNRIEGAPLKVVNRHGFLRQSRRMLRR